MTSPTTIPPPEQDASAVVCGPLEQPRPAAGPSVSLPLPASTAAVRLGYLFRRLSADDVPLELRRALYQYRGVPL